MGSVTRDLEVTTALKLHLPLSLCLSLSQEDNQPRSWWLKFEALCQYFSKSDCNSLLSLPQKPQEVCQYPLSCTPSFFQEVEGVHIETSAYLYVRLSW